MSVQERSSMPARTSRHFTQPRAQLVSETSHFRHCRGGSHLTLVQRIARQDEIVPAEMTAGAERNPVVESSPFLVETLHGS